MNCDRIAPFYEWIEKAMFGGRLQRHRVAFLNAAAGKQRILIVGDGDGRFTEAVVRAYPKLEVDCLEMSAGMVAETRERLRGGDRVRILHCDAMTFEFDKTDYDAIFTHFFLDCFTTETVTKLVSRISATLTRHGVWIVSDFREAPSGWRKIFTKAWLTTMYLFFHYATGLETKRLPQYASAFEQAGFSMRKEHVSMVGLVASEWWQR